jgi:hypothetical protein
MRLNSASSLKAPIMVEAESCAVYCLRRLVLMSEQQQEKTTVVLQKAAQPFHVQLVRGQRGGYGWKIDVQAESREDVLRLVDSIDSYLRNKFLGDSPVKSGSVYKPLHGGESRGENI